MMDALLSRLQGQVQRAFSFDELYREFKGAFPDRYSHSDGGFAFLASWLEGMKSQGHVSFTLAKYVLKGRHTFPAEIRLPQKRKKKTERTVRQWHPLLLGEDKGAKPDRIDYLEKLDTFLKQKPKDLAYVPIKARSLQIFGDEKLLGDKANLKTGQVLKLLTLDHLHCYVPSAYFLFSTQYDNDSRKVLIVENSETFHVMHLRNLENQRYRAVVYGAGNSFIRNAPFLETLHPVGGAGEFSYFGDIDIPGLEIPMKAQNALKRVGSEIVLAPATELYRETFAQGYAADVGYEKLHAWEKGQDCDVRKWTHDWLLHDRELATQIEQLVTKHKRLAQEWIGLS
jgi:hypothetical protein